MPGTRKRGPPPPPPSFVKASEVLKKRKETLATKIFDSGDEEIRDAAMIQAGLQTQPPSASVSAAASTPPGTARPPPPPVASTSAAAPAPKDDRLDKILLSISSLSGKFDGVKSDFLDLSGKIDAHAKTVENLTRNATKDKEEVTQMVRGIDQRVTDLTTELESGRAALPSVVQDAVDSRLAELGVSGSSTPVGGSRGSLPSKENE